MPLLPIDDNPNAIRPALEPGIRVSPVGERERPAITDTLGAAFRQDNVVGSLLANRDASAAELYKQEPGFDPFKEIADTPLEGQEDQFVDVFNRKAFEARKAQINMESEDRATLAASGVWGGLASFGAAMVDPTILLPGGVIARGVKGGYAIGRSIVTGAVSASAAAGVAETGLHATQRLRKIPETLFAIGGSAILGGVLGGAVAGVLSRAETRALAKGIDDLTRSPAAPDVQFANEGEVDQLFASAGAAAAPVETLSDLTIAGTAALKVGRASAWMRLNPLVRLLDSPSSEARSLGTGLFENPVYLRKNMEGQASDAAVETLVKEYSQGAVAKAMTATAEEFRVYRRAGDQLTYAEFRKAVGRAMRREDDNPVPEIAAAAKAWRSTVFDPLKDKAIEGGLLPKDVHTTTAASYFSRLWNWRKIEAQEPQFKAIVRRWIAGTLAHAETSSAEKFVSAADREDYIAEIVDEIFNRITGRLEGDLPRDIVPTTRGPLKDRTFNIPDHRVEAFLEDDVELVGRRYARVMAAEVELSRKFGSADLKEPLRRVQLQYAELRQAAGADLAKLNAREKRDLRDLKAVRDMLRGTYLARENATVTARALSMANVFNYVRILGGVVASSLSDVARPVMVHGLKRYMADGIVPLVTNLKAVKLSVAEARLALGLAERILNTRMATFAEITDPFSVGSPFERAMENIGVGFSKATLMPLWNDWHKGFSALLTQNRILQNSASYAGIRKTEKAYLAFLGIDESMASRIAGEFASHGHIDGVVRVAGTEDWTDMAARRAYRAAISKDVDSTIVTKGIADVPLFQHTPIGRTVLQFKSFVLASHQRAFMRGLQAAELGVDGGRSGTLAGVMAATGVGMLIYWLKSVESNRLADISDNPGRWLAEGLDRSGLFAIAFEINNTIEKYLGVGGYGALQAMFPDRDQTGKASRFANRNLAAAYTGPTGGLAQDLVNIIAGLKDGKISDADLNAIVKLVPFGTLPVLRSIVEYGLKPAIKSGLGLPREKPKRDKRAEIVRDTDGRIARIVGEDGQVLAEITARNSNGRATRVRRGTEERDVRRNHRGRVTALVPRAVA